MRKSRFSEEQITMALRQAESGTPVPEICRKLQVAEATFYRWKRQFGGLGLSELRELKHLKEENRKLKQLVADLSLDKTILQEALRKNWQPRPGAERWWHGHRGHIRSVSGGPAGCCRHRGPACVIAASSPRASRFEGGCGSWRACG